MPRRGLLYRDTPNHNSRFEILFSLDGTAGEAPEHGDLSDVSEDVGNGALKKFFDGSLRRFTGSEKVVELLERSEEAVRFRLPGKRLGIAPGHFPLRHGERPIQQIAEVSENFRGRAGAVANFEAGEGFRRAPERLSAAIGEGRNRVAEKLTSGIGGDAHLGSSLLSGESNRRTPGPRPVGAGGTSSVRRLHKKRQAGSGEVQCALEGAFFAVDLFLELQDGVEKGFRPGRTAGNVNVHGDDLVAALHDGVIIENAAGGRARAHGNDPLRFGHLIVQLANNRSHFLREAARDDNQVGLARRRTEYLRAETRNVKTRTD